MIPVALAQAPTGFDKKVRLPGLSAIDELVGRVPRITRRGRRRAKVAHSEAKIRADAFPPFWRAAIDDMMLAYDQRCAYLAVFIEDTGNPTVDHVMPKSYAWDKVDNGAQRALIPIENKRTFLDVSADIVEHVDPIFCGDAKTAAMKVLGGLT